MHYCTLLFSKEFPTKDYIDKIMDKYNYNNVEYNEETDGVIGKYPVFTWDWYQIGGRYNGQIKLNTNTEDKCYEWDYLAHIPRNERLFYSYLLTKTKELSNGDWRFREEDYYGSMGMRDGFLYVDGAKVKDTINLKELSCYICIDSDGSAIVKQSWNGKDFIEDIDFEAKFLKIKEKNSDGFVVVLDIHD